MRTSLKNNKKEEDRDICHYYGIYNYELEKLYKKLQDRDRATRKALVKCFSAFLNEPPN